jgi:hypothetical protein
MIPRILTGFTSVMIFMTTWLMGSATPQIRWLCTNETGYELPLAFDPVYKDIQCAGDGYGCAWGMSCQDAVTSYGTEPTGVHLRCGAMHQQRQGGINFFPSKD